MQSEENTAMPPLYSFGTPPHYEWSPLDALMNLMELDTPLHHAKPLPDSERKAIIESYPLMAHLEYRAPVTITTAERQMNRRQNTMLHDIRRLLLHVCLKMTQPRNNLALRANNSGFRLDNDAEVSYTSSLDEFQQTLVRQTAARKVARDATVNKKQRRFNRNSSNFGSAFSGSDPSFFRSGPPSEQGGFLTTTTTTTTTKITATQQQLPQPQFSIQQKQSQQQEEHQPLSPATATAQLNNSTATDPVGGRLSKHIQRWTHITRNSFVIINTVQHGYYIIPFHATPTSITPFSAEQTTLIDQAI
ncbi:hypothetical protein [Parasitella parasitica]|uniref:Uncharacterized protein n=1 Tax=Parasitella parasitica TaxID=35722 RepID=A0A0B7MY44_9FUNG|nr:hypothetical protein [Parasitella parasitica]